MTAIYRILSGDGSLWQAYLVKIEEGGARIFNPIESSWGGSNSYFVNDQDKVLLETHHFSEAVAYFIEQAERQNYEEVSDEWSDVI